MEKNVIIKYERGHSYGFIYAKTNIYCPSCGMQEVWAEQGEGDYYQGVDYACTSCQASFTLPSLGTNKNSYEGKQLIQQLKN